MESAVAARKMALHEVETTSIPSNCLDVLAQQIVAMVSVEDWDVDDLFDVIRQSYCYRTLSRESYGNVLSMLAGRYSNDDFRELRARISWDKQNNILRPLPASRSLAISGGGTIADRGYYGVYLEDAKTKIGEVDEEFVFESRPGDTFILGTSVWKMISLDANRITVRPAPGEPARMPFWRGEGIGRSFELSVAVGEFRRALGERLDDPGALRWLQEGFPVDRDAAWNILEYFRKQQRVAGYVPHDRLIVVEGFRDEIGDPRIVVHSCYGRGVNGLLGQIAVRSLHSLTGSEPQMLYNDNGVLLRCADMEDPPLNLLSGIDPAEAVDAVLESILSSPLYGGHFRQNASRSLLMPRPRPGKRVPLWLQRLKAADLLHITRRYDDFPIVIETMREVLNDILDLENFRVLLRGLRDGSIETRTVRTEVPSPFAASLLFDFIAVYMYELDQPRSDQLGQYLTVNRELLGEVVDLDSVGSMLRPEAIDAVNAQLQHTAEGYQARSAEELFEIMRRIGDLTEDELTERCAGDGSSFISELRSDGRAVRIDLGESHRWITGEESPFYASLESEENLSKLIGRFLSSRGCATPMEVSGRYALPVERVVESFRRVASDKSILPTGRGAGTAETTEWADRRNLERIHRQTISLLRKEIEPASLDVFAAFLARWQKADGERRRNDPADLEEILTQMQGTSLPVEVWEREILRRRIPAYARERLSPYIASGQFLWVGSGPGRMMIIRRGSGNVFCPPTDSLSPSGEPSRRILDMLRESGASFLADIRTVTGLSLHALNRGIAELFWKGAITNDQLDEVMNVRRYQRTSDERTEPIEPSFGRSRLSRGRLLQRARRDLKQIPGWTGRWSLVNMPPVMGPSISAFERGEAIALQIVRRYGIVAKEICGREAPVPWSAISAQLQRLELRGELRRGYFVKGLSGMQFAHPEAVEEIRTLGADSRGSYRVIFLNACDPACPYGPGINFPENRLPIGSVGRYPGNYIVTLDGAPNLVIENYGSRIWSEEEIPDIIFESAITELRSLIRLEESIRPVRQIRIEYWNGKRPAGSAMESKLREFGFRREANQTMGYDGY